MTRHFAQTATAALLIFAPLPALADVTSDDVWNNLAAYIGAFGGEMTGDRVTDGATTRIADPVARFALPMGLGTILIDMGTMTLTENGDGTVTVLYPDGTPFTFDLDLGNKGHASFTIVLHGNDYSAIASGQPGDITNTYDIAEYSIEITGLKLEGEVFEGPEFAALNLTGKFTATGNAGSYRITEGPLIKVALDGSYDSYTYGFSSGLATGASSVNTGSGGTATVTASMSLPAGGVGVMAIPAALRDGLAFALRAQSASTATDQIMTVDGMPAMTTTTSIGPSDSTISFDENGIAMRGIAEDYAVAMSGLPELPLPIEAAARRLEADVAFPLLSSDAPQDFTYNVAILDLTFADFLWDMFDPAASLPRDPATFAMDLSGQFSTYIDLLDFMAMAALDQSDTIPFELNALNIDDFLVSAVGAELRGKGGFTFDNTDMVTFDGIPAATGAIDLSLKGSNALMDKLVAMGLLPEDQAMMSRMMMGMFARPDGEDSLTSKIEIDGATGAISANGQRLQ